MDLPEARLTARHHLGDRLHWIGRGGPHADLWIVQAWPDRGHMLSAQGATVDAAAADCAAQLRAGGWVPTHARLEWRRENLMYRHHAISMAVWDVSPDGDDYIADCRQLGTGRMFGMRVSGSLPEVIAIIAKWCAKNLPLHLPPFPGAPQ